MFVEQPQTAVFVSWTIKDKNGVLKEYHVTYIRKNDSSETQTLATKKMEAQFELKAGKTYEFQVDRVFFTLVWIRVKSLREAEGNIGLKKKLYNRIELVLAVQNSVKFSLQ